MPDPKVLRAIQCGPHRILAAGPVPHQPQWLTPECCGDCTRYGRFLPCDTTSPDPACDPPPGKGVLYVCDRALCTADSPFFPGELWANFGQAGPPVRVRVIRWMGRCWEFQGFVPPADVPPGADVVELGGEVECIGGSCNDSPCGEPLGYAEALPCDPNHTGPRPIYCPAGLPFECSTFRVPGFGSECFTFRRAASTQPYPPQTPIVTFPPGSQDGITCCQCNCTPGSRLPHGYCPGDSPGGCCPDPAVWAESPIIADGYWRIDFDAECNGWPAGSAVYQEQWFTVSGTAGAPFLTVEYRVVYPGGDERGFSFQDHPMMPVLCPVAGLFSPDSGQIPPNNAPTIYESCFETRTINKWEVQWTGRNEACDGRFHHVQFQWLIRVIHPEPPGCSNSPCRGNLPIMPVVGSDGGAIHIRGGGSRQIDPAIAAMIEVQSRLGGCRGCGDGHNPA